MKLKYGPYSPSRLETAVCGHAFYKTYIDPERPKARIKTESLPQARGSAVHEVFEKITEELKAGRAVIDQAEVRKWVVEAVNRHPASYEETSEILSMAKLYIDRPPKLLTSDAGVELRLAVKYENGQFVECHYDDPDAFARGRADIFMISDDTTIGMIYDHKTQPNVEEADTFQMGIYAWVISKIYPFLDEIRTVLHFARYGHYSQPYVWTREDLAKIEDELVTRISIIESRTTWDPTPHKNCQYCPFMGDCPALDDYIEKSEDGNYRVKPHVLKILGSVDRAVQLAGLINILEDLTKRAKTELKEHVKAYGPIAIPGKIYSMVASEPKTDWDKVNKKHREEAYKIFEKYGYDPKLFMGFSSTHSNAVWLTENEAMVKELGALFPTTIDVEFRGKKA